MLLRRFLASLLVPAFAFALAGCTGSTTSTGDETATGSESSADPNSFQVEPTEDQVAGQPVLKFTYPTTRAARLVAARISEDGSMIGTKKMAWNGTPHFFRKENVMMLYLGNDEKVITILRSQYGDQFAGQ